MKTNDVILQTTTKVVFFIIFLFSIHIFFAGHYTPGGGFVGGLLTTGAIVLLLLAFDLKTVQKALPFNFTIVTGYRLTACTRNSGRFNLFQRSVLYTRFRLFHFAVVRRNISSYGNDFRCRCLSRCCRSSRYNDSNDWRRCIMEFIMAIVIGILFMAAVYLILSRSLLKIILGTGLLSHGAHLLTPDNGWTWRYFSASLGRWRNRLCGSFTAGAYFNGDCHQFRCDSVHPCPCLQVVC